VGARPAVVRSSPDDTASVASRVDGPGTPPLALEAPVLLPGGLIVRHVPNPRYRASPVTDPMAGVANVGRLRALDHVRAQIRRHGVGTRQSDWQVAGGEQYQGQNGVDATATGVTAAAATRLRTLRLDGRRLGTSVSLGDVTRVDLERGTTIQGMRGAWLRMERANGSEWRGFGGVPTPRPGTPTPSLALAGVAAEAPPFHLARLTFAAVGFERRGTPAAWPLAQVSPSPGRGMSLRYVARVPLAGGSASTGTELQAHTLLGGRAIAGSEWVEWTRVSPSGVWSVREQRTTRQLLILDLDRLAPAARRDERWNVQQRLLGGRCEVHAVRSVRDGGDPELGTHAFQWGGSAQLGRSAFFSGFDVSSDWRGVTHARERRADANLGWTGTGGGLVSGRIERLERSDGARALAFQGETSLPLHSAVRLALEPRLAWAGRLEQARLVSRLSWTLPHWAARVTGAVGLGAARDDATRGVAVQEASLALSIAPRSRDRGDFDVTRSDEGGAAHTDYGAAYELESQRFERFDEWYGSHDSSRVVVRVVRAGNRSGVADVLVSLDGKELRFTDDDGSAGFDRVDPGVHVVAVEERSLSPNDQVVGASRAFVTVERGRRPSPLMFEIQRPTRRVRFDGGTGP